MKLSEKHAQKRQTESLRAAAEELTALRDALRQAYAVFNRADDPSLLDASILEISALQARYDRALRHIKTMNGDLSHVLTSSGNSRRSRDRAGRTAGEAALQADQMGL